MQCLAPCKQASRPSCRPWRPCRQRCLVAPRATSLPLPAVDWRRRNLHCLFIDRSDTVRARFAVGMLERLSGWNACGQSLVGIPCGTEAAIGSRIDFTTQAALFGLADGWQMRPHLFTSTRQQFEPDDIDRFDVLVCLDSAIQATVLMQMSAARPSQPASYVHRICCITDFLLYCPDSELLQPGGSSILDRQLRGQVGLALPMLRPSAAKVAAAAASGGGGLGSSSGGGDGGGSGSLQDVSIPAYMLPTGISRPPLRDGDGGGSSSGGGRDPWEHMALLLVVCCVGLVRYLLDCRPDDLPDYDPVD